MQAEEDRKDTRRDEDDRAKYSGPPPAEWAVAALGLLLVAGTISFLIYQAVAGNSSPPDIAVEAGAISPVSGGYLVAIRVINRGGSSAKGVIVEGTLNQGESSVGKAETRFDYVPSRSERKGGLFFADDPRRFELQLRVLGYENP